MTYTKKKMLGILMVFIMIIGYLGSSFTAMNVTAASAYSLSGYAHVQTYGDKAGTYDGRKLTLGTTGQGKRLEAVTIKFNNNTGYSGTIQYRVHRQNYGWTGWVNAGSQAGTVGQGKRLEGIQMQLTGNLAKHYSIKYRVHIQTYGWQQGWQYDGALAGTEGEAKRLECLEVMLVPKNEEMGLTYRVHRQTYGWEMPYKKSGEVSGTTGQGKRLEGIELALTGNKYTGSIVYKTHVQSYGWMKEVQDGMMSGTSGQAKRLEAIQIRLTGEVANHYDVYYRVHAQTYGWLDWAKNNECAGTAGYAKRLEAIQILLVPKNNPCPSSNYKGISSNSEYSYVSTSGNVSGNSTENKNNAADSAGENSDDYDWDTSWDNDEKENNGCQHEFEYKKKINNYALIVDPYVEPNLFSRPLGAYCLTVTDDPYQGSESSGSFSGGTTTVHTGTYYIGNMINDHIFRTIDDEDIDINSLDWYCMHEFSYSERYVCKKCGYYKNEQGVTDVNVLDPWNAIRNNDENCTCFEFGKKQYGVIFFPKDNDPGNEIEVPYSRCKHKNTEPYEIEGDPCYDFILQRTNGYAKCKDCGAILSTCDHDNTANDEPYYQKFLEDTTAYKVTYVYCKDCKICIKTIKEPIPECSHKNTYKWTADKDKDYGFQEGTMCKDCGCIIEWTR